MSIPEQARARARRFLECWRTRNAVGSLPLLQLTWASKLRRAQLRKVMASRFDAQKLREFELVKFTRTMAICDVEASARFEKDGGKLLSFRMICEDEPYQPNAEGTGTWGVNPTSVRIEELPNENTTDSQAEAR